jgi:hypothetical protein
MGWQALACDFGKSGLLGSMQSAQDRRVATSCPTCPPRKDPESGDDASDSDKKDEIVDPRDIYSSTGKRGHLLIN